MAALLPSCAGDASVSDGTGEGGAPGGATGCAPAAGTTGTPGTIYEALDLINGLPHPVELPCLLESLERPLGLNATFNVQSAQPALGKSSPRIFLLLNDSMSMSLVPGAEAQTLEFGERDPSGTLSVKGELHFPIEEQLAPDDAFSRLSPDESTGLTLGEATSCGTCHDNEEPAPDYPYRGAFISAVVRPQPFFLVEVEALRQERDICVPTVEPERCAVLEALFDHGDVIQTPFP